jgi:hypothetical protein
MRPSLAIVAFAADQSMSPRGERALAVTEAAQRVADTELIGPPRGAGVRHRVRQLTRIASPVMLDCWEPEACWVLHRRRRRPDGALLVGFPFSAVYWAARWLAREGVKYVVDLGDPWALTVPEGGRPMMGGARASRCERFVWRHASAAVLTTGVQAGALQELFPALPIIVRPNGYRPAPLPAPRPRSRSGRTLRLIHYGNLYAPRLDIVPLISRLARCGRWESVVFTQQGEDWTGALRRLPRNVRVKVGRPRPWDEVVATASEHDLAVVVGNHNPAQLPSKAVQYLTLPIPRLAVVGGKPSDALCSYVRGKPGWLSLAWNAGDDVAGQAVESHVGRDWSAEQLAPPPGESWDAVAAMLVDVVRAHTIDSPAATTRPHAAPRAIAAASSSQPR